MSPNAAADQDALYYLYLNGEWAGPYQVGQIRTQVEQGAVATDSYAYDAAQQRHYTVEELLAAPASAPASAATSEGPGSESGTITQGMPALFDDVVDMAPQSSASFDAVLPDLKVFYTAYLGLTEHTAEPKQALKDLHGAHQGLIQELDHRRSDTKTLSRVINEIDEVADYLANRHQISQLWSLLSELEKVDLAVAPDEAVACARAVLASLTGRAESQSEGANGDSSSVLLDLAGLDDEADSVITRKILLSARSEVASTKRDMDVLQQTYNELQEQHAKDLEKARKLLEKAEAARAEERHTARQTAAEVRNLAAEIQRLANEADITGGEDQDLVQQIVRLGEELRTAEASTLAYMAEDVLIRMVAQLRQLAAGSGGDSAPLRTDLARVRENLVHAQTQVAQLTSERDTLRLQYEQSCLAAEKASERAKDREHRLRSTVTALEVTKELHQEVMDDLKVQLQSAQGRVEQMERDLASVRGEMKDSTGSVEARGKAIQHEMQRMVEMKALLEVRSSELSANLKSAEDELAKAQSSDQDANLAEALAAKVTQLRTTYEVTTNRLKDQEAIAERLKLELEASRTEAQELRGRSDQLSGELGEARGSLSAAKHRLDELHQAYARLEAERQSLHTELHHRQSTDTIHKQGDADSHQSERIAKLEHDGALLQRQLANEKRLAEQFADTRRNLETRVAEITAERNDLQRKVEFLQNEHFNDHSRHTAAIAVSTQAAIESERRLRELQNRVADLEAQLRSVRKSSEVDGLEPTTARVAGHSNALETSEQQGLRAELEQVARERDQVLAQLETIRTASAITPRASEVPEAVARRLIELERELTAATASIAALDERHAQAAAERDRLRRDFERLRNERESAAVEHRTALKSARDRLTESQERVAELERHLADRATSDTNGLALRGHLDQSLAEQERLSKEVQRLASELARLNASVPADRDQQLIGLAKASHQLASEQEKVLVLTRSLMETLQQADSARGRTLELQSLLDQRTGERDHLQQQLDRQRAELTNLRLGLDAGTVPDSEVRDGIARRDQTLADLDQVRKDLAEARARLATTHRADSALEGLGQEQARIRELEKELAALRGEADQRQQMFNEARARLVQVSSERDRLAAELLELKSRPDQEVELKMLRRRLIRAKRQIKRLRKERDAAIAERQRSATNLHELTGQIERLKLAQRAAAEALGLPPSAIPLDPPTTSSISLASGNRPAILTREFHPLDLSGSRQALGAGPRPLAGGGGGEGLVSAFGRPRIISKTTNYGNVPVFTSRLGSPSVGQSSHPALVTAKTLRPARIPRKLLLAGAIAGGLVVGAGLWAVVLPGMFPISNNAVVNSKVSIARSGIEGMVKDLKSRPGDQIALGQLVANVQNDRLDLSQLHAFQADLQNTRLLVADLQKRRDADTGDQTRLLESRNQWRTGRVQALKASLESTRDAQTLARGTMDEADARLRGLRQAGVPAADLVEPAIAYERVKLHLASADKAVADLEAACAAITAGERDAEWERHGALDEITTRLSAGQAELPRLTKVIVETEERIAAEESRIARLRAATVTATRDGKLLRLLTAEGRWLHSGDPIASIADPTSVVIDCVLPDSRASDIVPGSEIVAYLITDRREVRGRVIAKIEPGPSTANEGEWAEDFVGQHHFRTIVRIGLEGVSLDSLQISQGVRVMFLGSNPSLIDRGLAALAQIGRF